MIDFDRWLSPLEGDNPSGKDLRNDARFHELERLAQPQVEVTYDDHNRPSSEKLLAVDWRKVLAKAEEVGAAGRDLRLLVIVVRALASEEGFAGLAQGLTLIGRTLADYWETMHPALRQGSGGSEAALRRMNALADLQNGKDGLLFELRERVWMNVAPVGPVRGVELEKASLDDASALREAPGLGAAEAERLRAEHGKLIDRVRIACAEFAKRSPQAMSEMVADLDSAIAALDFVDAAVRQHLPQTGAAVPDLRGFLERVRSALRRGHRQPQAVAAEPPPEEGPPPPPAAAGLVSNGHAVAALPQSINSRDDVVRCLDLVIDFYDRGEPSSPIPHVARRIRRMVHMDFIELMEDLAPAGLKEFRLLAGAAETKKPAQKE